MVLGLFSAGFAHADTVASATTPVITTSSTPSGGTSLDVQFPSNYSGEVTSTFDGTTWHTVTKPYSAADQAKIQAQIKSQEQSFDQLFAQEQAFFTQQQQLMDSFWKNFPTP